MFINISKFPKFPNQKFSKKLENQDRNRERERMGRRWKNSKEVLLMNLVGETRLSESGASLWNRISNQMPGKTPLACRNRWWSLRRWMDPCRSTEPGSVARAEASRYHPTQRESTGAVETSSPCLQEQRYEPEPVGADDAPHVRFFHQT